MFDLLTAKFEDLFYKIRNKGKLSPNDLDSALREIKLALLEADVNFKVVKEFIENVKAKATGEKILESLTPYQHVVKIVNEEIIRMLGSSSSGVSFASRGPTIIMTVGLHGSGKTSSVIKLANFLKTKFQKKVSVIAADVYRPAAVLQLEDMAKNIDVDVYSENNSDPVAISVRGVELFKKSGSDVIIIDTAGRLHNKVNLMKELTKIKNVMQKVIPDAPHEILLILDASTGQNAIEQATQFTAATEVNALALTKLDGTAKGGVAIGISEQFKVPVKYIGIGEGKEDLQIFDKFEFVDSLFDA